MNIHHEKVIGVRLARKSVKNMTPFFHYQITMLKHFHEICFKKEKNNVQLLFYLYRMYIRTMIAFLPIWHFLEVGLSGDHIDMVKMRYKKPFQRALEHYHAEEEIRQAALKWKGMPITPHPNPRCTALM